MSAPKPPEPEPLMTPQEVAMMFRVDAKTVTRWAKAGKLDSIRTAGNHRRYRTADVLALYHGTAECPACHYETGSPGHRRTCLGATS
jgi:excisionase family DNA binding protein